jgi:hypothetical protein
VSRRWASEKYANAGQGEVVFHPHFVHLLHVPKAVQVRQHGVVGDVVAVTAARPVRAARRFTEAVAVVIRELRSFVDPRVAVVVGAVGELPRVGVGVIAVDVERVPVAVFVDLILSSGRRGPHVLRQPPTKQSTKARRCDIGVGCGGSVYRSACERDDAGRAQCQ